MRLFFFTESFPYGLGESWKYIEIKYLSTVFEEIMIIPMWNGNNPDPVKFDNQNITVLPPALENYIPEVKFQDLKFILNGKVFKEIIGNKLWLSKAKMVKVLLFYKRVKSLMKTRQYREIMRKTDGRTVWYFYWGRGWADILPFSGKLNNAKTIVRFHGYDLYKERNFGYIPFRNQLLDKLDLALLVSENGKRYILNEYRVDSQKVEVCRIGTTHKGLTRSSSDNIIRVVSCSGMVPVKRIDRILNALKKIYNLQVQWTHIGDGPLLDSIQSEIIKLPPNISVKLQGKLSPEGVSQYYLSNPVDLFINVSESEGVPVSVMEAFSFGIPVIATNVGGTSEIVDSEVGMLLSNDNVENRLIEGLEAFANLPDEKKRNLRTKAHQRYKERCDAIQLSKNLGEILISANK